MDDGCWLLVDAVDGRGSMPSLVDGRCRRWSMPSLVDAVDAARAASRARSGVALTERKSIGTSWESWTERRIRQAMEEGAFEGLEGAGEPIADLDREYDPQWWVKSWLRRQKLSVLPPDLTLRKRVEQELEAIWRLPAVPDVRRRVAELNVEIARANATGIATSSRGLALLEPEEIVVAWQRRCDPARTSAPDQDGETDGSG